MKQITLSTILLCISLTIFAQNTSPFSTSALAVPPERGTIAVGLLNGGGGLIGADFEIMMNDKIGIQAGLGFISYGAGINYHLNMGGVRSSFINIGYWHQGLNDTYYMSLLGPSFVLRLRKLLQAQLGIGAVVDEGPAADQTLPPMMLTYSVALYFPFR